MDMLKDGLVKKGLYNICFHQKPNWRDWHWCIISAFAYINRLNPIIVMEKAELMGLYQEKESMNYSQTILILFLCVQDHTRNAKHCQERRKSVEVPRNCYMASWEHMVWSTKIQSSSYLSICESITIWTTSSDCMCRWFCWCVYFSK